MPIAEHQVLSVLQKCTWRQLKQIHALIIITTLNKLPIIRLKFLQRSTEYGQMEYANLIFVQMGGLLNTETTLWNAMIRGYAYNGPFQHCLHLFDEMSLRNLKPNNYTYPYVLNSCYRLGLFCVGQRVHGQIIKSGFNSYPVVENELFYFYLKKTESFEMGAVLNGKSKSNDARKIFDGMCRKTIESGNKMICHYLIMGDINSGRDLFDEMTERDFVSWNTMISGYSKVGDVTNASDLFDKMPQRNVVSWTSMLTAYANAGDVETARNIFDEMPERNLVSWNCMMSSYYHMGKFKHTLDIFARMQSEGIKPDSFSFVSALSACSNLNDLESGKSVHYMIHDWHEMGVIVGTSLADMYANCGDIDNAFTIFIKIGNKDIFCYNVMIKSLAINGRAKDAIKIFHLIQKLGMKMNDFTFVCALFACSHSGLVKEGRKIFESMERKFSITPKPEHFCCMIDMLCRNDEVEEAESLMRDMNVEPDIAVWGALLGGCRERGNIKLGEGIVSKAVELRCTESGVFALLSNIYASKGQWADALQARKPMEENGVRKQTGCSSILE